MDERIAEGQDTLLVKAHHTNDLLGQGLDMLRGLVEVAMPGLSGESNKEAVVAPLDVLGRVMDRNTRQAKEILQHIKHISETVGS